MNKVWVGIKSPPLTANPEIGAVVEAVQEKVVPTTFEVRSTLMLVPPEQMVCSKGQFVTVGLGLIVTIWVAVVPGQPLNEEVIV